MIEMPNDRQVEIDSFVKGWYKNIYCKGWPWWRRGLWHARRLFWRLFYRGPVTTVHTDMQINLTPPGKRVMGFLITAIDEEQGNEQAE